MAGAKSEDTGVIAAALLRAQWVAGRAAFGAAVPDVPGLMDGRPERHALFMWLDAALCRDADRALRAMMDDDPNLKPEAALGADETVRRINLSARRAGEALGAAMASLR
jgi:predicted 2-oxoglutarate/Fe(II)-dependent dioxygenase YbiX